MSLPSKKKAVALFGAAALFLLAVFGTWQLGHGLYIKTKAEVAQVLLERAWTKTLEDGRPHKAWYWADAWPVAKIEFPSLGASHIVLSNSSGEALAFGPGHLPDSPLPGRAGTSVIAAHRDTHFSILRDLENDERVIITTIDGRKHSYKVRQSRIVYSDNSHIDPRAAGGLALVTCYPFDSTERGPLRYVVFATVTDDLT
jgi:sortase A